MSTRFLLVVPLLPVVAALMPAAGTEENLPGLARNVVVQSARVREGDLVRIMGSPGDIALLEELAVQVRKRGAHPLLTVQSDRLERRYYEEVPARLDAQPPAFELKLAGLVDVQIGMESREEDTLAGIPAERLVTVNKAAEAVAPTLLKRNVRTVWLGNRLYPSAARAKRYGIREDELARLFRSGLAASGEEIRKSGALLKKTLESGRKLHLTGPGGTDLTLDVTKRPVMTSNGVLTPEREKKGGAECITWLPAGELYLTPVAGSVEGTVVVERAAWLGKPIKNLTLTFKAGKLTSMKAESGAEELQSVYAKQRPGKELFGVVDFGINPRVLLPAGSKVQTYIAAGMVTVTLGNNSWAGGDNTVNFGLDCHLPGCTVTVDETTVVEKGRLK